MDLHSGPPPGLPRPRTSPPPSLPATLSSSPPPPSPRPNVASPVPRRATAAPWASSLASGLFPSSFPVFPHSPQVTCGLLPSNAAVQSTVRLYNNSDQITDLSTGSQALSLVDPWHRAHACVCAHALIPCAACSVALFCCTCRALRFTPGPPPASPLTPGHGISPTLPSPAAPRRSWSSSPVLFRNVGNGTPPPGFDSHCDDHDDEAYAAALVEADTCDNPSCPRGAAEPATYSITVEQFDEGSEEAYDRIFRACSACNRSCRKSFMGHRIKSRTFDNSAREALANRTAHDTHSADPTGVDPPKTNPNPPPTRRFGPIPGSAAYAREHPVDNAPVTQATPPLPANSSLPTVTKLQDALLTLSARPATPATFVATVRVKHDILCSHPVSSCPTCSHGLVCCDCKRLFMPAVARHLACLTCKHVAFSCCDSTSCCNCGKFWMPTDSILPPVAFTQPLVNRFRGGAGSGTGTASSPEPDIWTPSPRSSPDEIDDLTARANVPLPTSRSESDASRAPSRASSVDVPADLTATPLPTPDFSSLADDAIDGLSHPSFPDRAILDSVDRRHFLGRGDC